MRIPSSPNLEVLVAITVEAKSWGVLELPIGVPYVFDTDIPDVYENGAHGISTRKKGG